MSTVSKSAAISATQLFSTITTTANAISTGVSAVGNLFDELNLRSSHRLAGVRTQLEHDRITQSTLIRKEAAINLARSIHETEKALTNEPELKAAYEKALELFASKLDPQPQA